MSLTKKDLIRSIANGTDLSQPHVEAVLNHLTETAQAELSEGREVVIPGIGKFSTQLREARQGRNPKTGESIDIPAKTVVKFTVAKALKDAVA